jgi:hypothetical protein
VVTSSTRGPGCEAASDQLADADQGLVFRPLSLSEAYLGAIEKEAFVTLRYSLTLPLAGNKSLQENATKCEGQRGWQH